MTREAPTPAKAAEPADLREALCSHHWHEAFGVTTGRSWRRAVAEAEERGPDSAAAEQVARFRNCADRQIAGPLAQREAAHAAEIQAREAEIAGLRAALTLIATASPEPDDKQWRDIWNDPASYRWLGTDGVVRETSVDISNRDDVESFGYERGTHTAAVTARAALKTKGGEDV